VARGRPAPLKRRKPRLWWLHAQAKAASPLGPRSPALLTPKGALESPAGALQLNTAQAGELELSTRAVREHHAAGVAAAPDAPKAVAALHTSSTDRAPAGTPAGAVRLTLTARDARPEALHTAGVAEALTSFADSNAPGEPARATLKVA
jgi:hypothetical protein